MQLWRDVSLTASASNWDLTLFISYIHGEWYTDLTQVGGGNLSK